ncbi:MAG: efflux RND transporter permease subunit [Candidatus Marinarcus sp.]|uniref:efflux RND transporter permease subunit n=1 Tax=Candidatus Marinarcus sp. TaxID=3100987 RepID=UPI003B0035DE
MPNIKTFVTLCIQNRRNKTVVLLATLFLFLASIAFIPLVWVKAKMLPEKNANNFTIYVDLPNGSSINETKNVTDMIAEILQKEQEITDVEVFLGTSSPLSFEGLVKGSGAKSGEHFAEIVVNLTKKHDRDEPSFLMVQRLRIAILNRLVTMSPNTTIKMVEPPAGPPVLAAVVAEIYGENQKGIETLSNRVSEVFKHTDGLVDIDVLNDDSYDEYKLVFDYEKIKRYGLDINAITKLISLAFNGKVVATKNSKEYDTQLDLFLRMKQRSNTINDALMSLKIRSMSGALIALKDIVHVKNVANEKTLHFKNLSLMLNVVAQTDMVSQIYPLLDARRYILDHFGDEYEVRTSHLLNLELTHKTTHEKYQLVWDGELKVTLDTFRDLGGAFITALILIFLLMVVYYKNFALSGIVLLSSFLSIIGVIIGHFMVDVITPHTFFLTATSLIGFIALIGISSRNALLLIDFTKQLIKEGVPKKEAIITSTTIRAKPIFLTALAVILASTLLASDAVFGGLGVALIFGTIAAVIASLIVVPVLIDNIDESKLLI